MQQAPAGTELQVKLRLRPMQTADLPAIYRLEVISQPRPWPYWFFRRQLRKGSSCWVLEITGEIIGFGIIAFVKDRAHVLNICIAPEYRRQGLGRRVLLHLLDVARQHHCRRVWLEVRRNNRAAILLYRKLGFRTRRIRKGYYRTRRGRQDGLLMARSLR